MSVLATQLPVFRADLVIRPIGGGGRYVVKLPGTHDYFHLGEEEHFLLAQLDGRQRAEEVCTAFAARFGVPLALDELDGFIDLARERKMLEECGEDHPPVDANNDAATGMRASRDVSAQSQRRQSLLYWRKSVIDPDGFFSWLEPKIRFCWTRAFLVVSTGCIVLAMLILWTGRQEIASSFVYALRWETLVLTWVVFFAVGMLHESAHGLTCKHYGGEVREIGLLLMYFMPCFYCNVSDAWLFREKWKRLWVTFAGGYFELFLWALAVFVWRVTVPDSLPNYVAFIVAAGCGINSLLNFNPLIKFDGYYLLSDWLEIPNLRARSVNYVMERLQWLLWGAPKPATNERSRLLLGFGLSSWLYSLTFVTLMIAGLHHWLSRSLGVLALPIVGVLGVVTARGLVGGLLGEEFRKMIRDRHLKTVCWLLLLAGLVVGSFLVPWSDRAAGEFEVRAATHAELRAPVAGFLKEVLFDEGEAITDRCVVARLAIPDLESRIARKEAELREARAQLALLQAGTRAEQIEQQKRRVEVVHSWRDLSRRNLEAQKQALQHDLLQFDKLLDQYAAERDHAQAVLEQHENLKRNNAVSHSEYSNVKKAHLVACARYEQTVAEKQSRAARSALAAESELAERETQLAQEEAALTLLEAGTRPEEIEAAQATVARLSEEVAYLNDTCRRLTLRSPVGGVIMSCRLKERVGDYFNEGQLICEVEDARSLEVVISLDEDQAARVQPGQKVRLKARSLPFDVFEVEVERVAPRAEKADADVQSRVNVYCRLDDPSGRLRSGMTGYARVRCGEASVASIIATGCLRFVRTEFWW